MEIIRRICYLVKKYNEFLYFSDKLHPNMSSSTSGVSSNNQNTKSNKKNVRQPPNLTGFYSSGANAILQSSLNLNSNR